MLPLRGIPASVLAVRIQTQEPNLHSYLGFSKIQAELTNLAILPNFGLIRLISLICLILPKLKIP